MKVLFMRFSMFLVTHIVSYLVERMEQFVGLIPDSRYLVQNQTAVRLVIPELFLGLIPDSRYLVQNQTDVRLVISEHFRTSIPDSWYVQKQICDPIPSGLFFCSAICFLVSYSILYNLVQIINKSCSELFRTLIVPLSLTSTFLRARWSSRLRTSELKSFS